MKLLSLQPEGIRLVTPELAAGSLSHWPESAWKPLITDAESELDLDALDSMADELIVKMPRHDPAIDAWLAPRLHRALPLTRRQASDAGIWRYLAVVHRPDVVRHRWENQTWATMRLRFWSLGTRHTSNLFARLWWIAQLTERDGSYALTERVLERQSLAIQIFVRSWSQHRPAVVAFADALKDAPADKVEQAARALSRHLATMPLEGMDEKALASILRSQVDPDRPGRSERA